MQCPAVRIHSGVIILPPQKCTIHSKNSGIITIHSRNSGGVTTHIRNNVVRTDGRRVRVAEKIDDEATQDLPLQHITPSNDPRQRLSFSLAAEGQTPASGTLRLRDGFLPERFFCDRRESKEIPAESKRARGNPLKYFLCSKEEKHRMKFLIILCLTTIGVVLVEGKTEHPVESELLEKIVECYQREKCHERAKASLSNYAARHVERDDVTPMRWSFLEFETHCQSTKEMFTQAYAEFPTEKINYEYLTRVQGSNFNYEKELSNHPAKISRAENTTSPQSSS
ncbi:hypothetical protein TSAR_007801 [Trichomalopsis sarcophagae]|uniref:Uncharacterized protein n=1 Tax=Trichomalopsis sarcophagae TaxID=543379 RepID=A0A232F0I0_9HYME|nr:hypothetical protein TSAR_007801 [Trichomalopsis sarcophagae]